MFKGCLFLVYSLSLKLCKFAWASTNSNKLKKLNSQQKHAARIICNEERYTIWIYTCKTFDQKLKYLECLSIKYYSNSNI